MHSKQGFQFEIEYSMLLLEIIQEGYNTKEKIKNKIGIGENKINNFIEWILFIEAIEIEDRIITISNLGKFYLKIRDNLDYIEPIILYNLIKNPDINRHNHGNLYFSILVNDIFSKMFSDYNKPHYTINEIKREFKKNKNYEEKSERFLTQSLSSLVDAETGFGKMGIVEKVGEDEYKVHSYYLEPLVALYIICDMWDTNQTAMSIDDMISEDYNLGKMFLMDESTISDILEELQVKRYIVIEKSNTLNQIKLMDGVNKEFVLKEIIKDA